MEVFNEKLIQEKILQVFTFYIAKGRMVENYNFMYYGFMVQIYRFTGNLSFFRQLLPPHVYPKQS